MGKKILLKDFLHNKGRINLQLEIIAGEAGLSNEAKEGDINRPGLTLAGFTDFFAYDRIQIFGMGETAFLRKLECEKREETLRMFFSYNVLCCIFTHGEEPCDMFIKIAAEKNIPIMKTSLGTTRFISLLIHVMDELFAPSVTLHATLVEVFGVGVLIMGKSGAGKSESALELVERGHRLVADDAIEIKKIDESILIGAGSPILKHHMEIRGIGIINVKDLFGIRSVRDSQSIDFITNLEEWNSEKVYDRLGLDDQTYNILGIEVPYMLVPVKPGRNISILIETAALNQRLKYFGIYSARELDKNIKEMMKKGDC